MQTPARLSLCLCPTLNGYREVTLPERNPSLGSFLIQARVRWKKGLGWILRPGGNPKNLTRLGSSRGVPRNRGTNAGQDSVEESSEGSIGHFHPSLRLRRGGGEIGILKVVTYCHILGLLELTSFNRSNDAGKKLT